MRKESKCILFFSYHEVSLLQNGKVRVENGQKLTGVSRGCGFMIVMDFLFLGVGYKSKTARIQQMVARIL